MPPERHRGFALNQFMLRLAYNYASSLAVLTVRCDQLVNTGFKHWKFGVEAAAAQAVPVGYFAAVGINEFEVYTTGGPVPVEANRHGAEFGSSSCLLRDYCP